jgi:hypothetical protein
MSHQVPGVHQVYIQKSLIPIEKIPIPSILAFHKESSSTKKTRGALSHDQQVSCRSGNSEQLAKYLCLSGHFFLGNIIKVDRKLEVILFIIILPSKKTVIFGILNFRHHIFGPSFGLGLRAFWGSRALAESRKPEDFHHVQSMVKTMILGDFPLEHHWKIYGKSHGKTEHHWKIIVKTHGKSHGILLIDFHWKTIGTSDSLIYIYIGTSDQHIHIYIYIYIWISNKIIGTKPMGFWWLIHSAD